MIAAPLIFLCRADSCLLRIVQNISCYPHQLGVIFHRFTVVPALEQVPHPLIFLIKIIRITYPDPFHTFRDHLFFVIKKQVRVILHQAVGAHRHPCFSTGLLKYLQVVPVIRRCFEQQLFSDSPLRYVQITAFRELSGLTWNNITPFSCRCVMGTFPLTHPPHPWALSKVPSHNEFAL